MAAQEVALATPRSDLVDLHVRVPPEVAAALDRMAVFTRRSRTAMAAVLLEVGLAETAKASADAG